MKQDSQPIGVFDSGVGGLTVLKSLQQALPYEDFIYLGDTARLPYGTKSQETIIAYAKQAVLTLMQFDIKLLVIACNTASALALDALTETYPDLPIIGVLQPGAEAACKTSQTGTIGLLATESTIHSHGYRKAIQAIRRDAVIVEQPCSLFVSIAEEGWADNQVAIEAANIYLQSIKANPNLDCVLLGCTHFPVLRKVIQNTLGAQVKIVDSATTTTEKVVQILRAKNALHEKRVDQKTTFLATDSPHRFQRMASIFLGEAIDAQHVEPIKI